MPRPPAGCLPLTSSWSDAGFAPTPTNASIAMTCARTNGEVKNLQRPLCSRSDFLEDWSKLSEPVNSVAFADIDAFASREAMALPPFNAQPTHNAHSHVL